MPSAPGPRVLIVDDEPAISFGLSRTLARRGYTVAAAGTAAETRATAADFRPDLVLLDLRLPDEDGLVLLDELLRLSPPPRVLVMTGFALAETADRALAKGAARVIRKPIEIDELLKMLGEVAAEAR